MFKTVVFSTVELITVVVDEITGVSVVVQRGFFFTECHISGKQDHFFGKKCKNWGKKAHFRSFQVNLCDIFTKNRIVTVSSPDPDSTGPTSVSPDPEPDTLSATTLSP